MRSCALRTELVVSRYARMNDDRSVFIMVKFLMRFLVDYAQWTYLSEYALVDVDFDAD